MVLARRRFARLALVASITTLTIAAAPSHAVDLVFSSGPTGGSWIPMAAATAQVVKKRFPDVNVQVEPGAALVNMEKIRTDKADLGWSMTTVLSDARTGTRVFKGKKTDRPLYVANYYPNVWQLIVPADSEIKSVKDLRGKAVALPARGNTSLADGWELLLQVNGMSLNDLGTKSYGPVSSNGEAMRNRQAIAAGWFTGVPASFVLDVGSAMKLRMIAATEDEIAKLRKLNPGFARYVVKAGTYAEQGIPGEVVTFQSPTILIASSKASEDAIYKVTKAIVEGRAEFGAVAKSMAGVTAAQMAENFDMPYHPGAARYYKEAGLIK
ncbi:MAG: TAXI family TRAP transporter solute-binding subunit [Burkholderiales bacterium]|nr:TAXI family TRAP transporter solute-binding subunit [Burkholderiales bacterium]